MTTNTEIKTWQERVAPAVHDDFVRSGYGIVHAAMFAEIADLRAALEAKQQALEAAQQVVQRAGSGDVSGRCLIPDSACKQGKCANVTTGCWGKCHLQDPGYTVCYAPPAAVQPDSEPRYQVREIGEGDWRDASKGEYEYCRRAPEMDTRIFVAKPINERLQNWIDVIQDNERSMGDRLQHLAAIFGGLLRGDAMGKYPLAAIREQQPDSGRDAALRTAVAAFIKAKGRYHTEQGYKALVEAFDKS